MNPTTIIRDIKDAIDDIQIDDMIQLQDAITEHKHIIILGNGGSNAIAQHMAIDYTKVLHKQCIAFGDSPRLTCYMNDYGVERAYRQYLHEFVQRDSLVILISSSGDSENIIKCADYCDRNGIDFIILTGFKFDNKLRSRYGTKAKADIWVDSMSYSVVECTHEVYLHSIVGN